MPRNNNNGRNNRSDRNNRNNRANNKRVSSDNEEQLELIKVNVDKVKKDVSEISVHTRKEISAITKKMDELISTMEKSMKVMANQTAASAKTMQQMNEQQMKSLEAMNDLVNERIDAEKKITNQKKEQTKESQKQSKNDDNNKNKGGFSSETTDNWLKNYNDKKGNTDRILDAIKGKSSALFTHKTDKAMDDIINKMREVETSNASFSQKEKELDILTNQYKSLDASAGKLKAASAVFDTTVSVLRKTVQIWSNRFFSGMEKIINTYEDTFQSQAVMTGISQQEYFDYQNNEAKKLSDLGLQNNIAMSDVMAATSQFVNKGITNFAEASEMGQTEAIGKVLAPYLDQQSDAFISLSQTMGPKFTKTMTGLATSVSSQVGQSRFIVKNIDTMVNDMQYMTLAARKSLMSEDMQNRFELVGKLTGTSQEQLMNMYTDLSDLTTNRLDALENGNLAQRTAAASGETTWEGLAKVYSETLGMGKGFDINSAQGQLAFDAFRKATETSDVIGYNNANNIDMIQKILSASDSELSELIKQYGTGDGDTDSGEESYQKKFEKLSNDQLQTTIDMKKILEENISTKLATLAQKYPDTYNVLKDMGSTMIGTLTGFLGGKFIEKIGGKLLGKIGSKLFGKTAIKAAGNIIGGEQLSLFGNTAKTGLGSKIGSGLKAAFTTTGKSGLTSVLSSTGAKVLGGVGGAIMTVKDAIGGYKKADQWFEKDNNGQPATTGQKVSSVIGGALGGTGPGVFDEGASTGDKVKNVLGGAAKGAMIGTMFGPIGTAVGGLVGAGLSALGGEKISKGLSKLGEGIKDTASKVGSFVSDRWKDMKEGFGKLADNVSSAFGDFINFLTGIPEKLVKGLKWGIDSFMTATQNMFSALLNIPIFIANSAIGLVNGIKNSLKSFAVNIADKIGQGNNVASWFPEDMPTLEYSKMQSMPDISSYATGTDYIKANGQFAYLHEGEAVLTKSAATLLRTQTSENISTASGVTSALEANSSISKEYITTIVTAINDQTAALIAKMDEIYQKILANNYRGRYSSSLVELKSN